LPGPGPAPPAWTPGAQRSAVALLGLALVLLVWHAYSATRRAARPTALERGADKLDLNHADRTSLMQLPGVGEGLARRIEEHRQRHGKFRQVEELRQVQGVGPVLLHRLRPLVHVGSSEAEASGGAVGSAPRQAPAGNFRGGRKPPLTGPVDVNSAPPEELRRLPRIGPKLAQRIVEARAARPFRSADDLRRVRGIGPKTLEGLRPHVVIGRGGGPAPR
jgi:competence protein ComEA